MGGLIHRQVAGFGGEGLCREEIGGGGDDKNVEEEKEELEAVMRS